MPLGMIQLEILARYEETQLNGVLPSTHGAMCGVKTEMQTPHMVTCADIME